MQLGLSLSLTRGDGARGFTRFVDSVNGADANNGLTAATAKQTIAGLGALSAGMRIGLARGSVWREQIGSNLDTTAGVVIGAYGSGRLPILDAADVVTAWTKTVGRTNIYEATITHASYSGGYPSLWEDAIRLRWISTLDLLDAAPGRFHAANTTGTSFTIYVHCTGSGDPTANGKTYEAAVRLFGIASAGVGWSVSNVHTKRQLHNDGSTVLSGVGSILNRCLFEDGTKHNVYIGRNCHAYDCIAWKHDWADRTNSTLFVGHSSNGLGYSVGFHRCIAVGELAKIVAANAAGQAIDGFYAHTSTPTTGCWDEVRVIDCSGYGVNCNAGDTTLFTVTRFYAEECRDPLSSAAVTTNILDPRIHSPNTATIAARTCFTTGAAGITVNIEGLRAYVHLASTRGDVYVPHASTVNIAKSAIYRQTTGGTRYIISGHHASSVINSTQNIVYGDTNSYAFRQVGTGSSENNVYYPSTSNFTVGGTDYNDFAAYRAANPTYDMNTSTADPLLVDPANGDFNVSVGSPAIALGAGLERPSITYTAIPPDAALAAM